MEPTRAERFERIYNAHYAAVLAYALRRAARAEADDVVAETFTVAWRRLADVPDEPRPWLYATARRVLANRRRADARRAALIERLRPAVRRLAVAGATLALATAGASALLLAGGEQPGAPPRFAVLTALAHELNEPGRILHTLERTAIVGTHGDVHEEETWVLLDDMRYQRFRIGTGRSYEEGATTPTSSSGYERRTNTLTVARHAPLNRPLPASDLPVERLARAAAEGRIPVEARVEIDGRRALKIRDGSSVWYIAEDAPVLLRYDLKRPDKRIQRTDFIAFEILPATPENRRLLEIDPPAGAERRTVRAPDPNG